jgi:hypothetical protein
VPQKLKTSLDTLAEHAQLQVALRCVGMWRGGGFTATDFRSRLSLKKGNCAQNYVTKLQHDLTRGFHHKSYKSNSVRNSSVVFALFGAVFRFSICECQLLAVPYVREVPRGMKIPLGQDARRSLHAKCLSLSSGSKQNWRCVDRFHENPFHHISSCSMRSE